MNKFKRFFNGRLIYSLAVGILAVGIAATGAMLLGGNGEEEEAVEALPTEEPDMEVTAAAAGVVKTISSNEEIGNYVVEGCNLYFKVTKDGSPVDPMDYIHE